MNPEFSILITTRNRPDLIKRQINYLEDQLSNFTIDFEVIFYDDFSDVPLTIRDSTLNISLYRGDKNIGLIAARNFLMEKAHPDSSYFFFLDDDIFVYGLPQFLNLALKYLSEGYGTVCLPYLNLPFGRGEKISEFRFIKNLKPQCDDVVFFNGGSSAFSREAIKKVGPLEGEYFFYLEEEDLSIRLFQNNIPQKVIYGENFLSIHDQPKDKVISDRRIFLLSNRLVFHYKYIGNPLLKFSLDTMYKVLYLIKMKNLTHFNEALKRGALVKSKVLRTPFATFDILRFFRKRYFNL